MLILYLSKIALIKAVLTFHEILPLICKITFPNENKTQPHDLVPKVYQWKKSWRPLFLTANTEQKNLQDNNINNQEILFSFSSNQKSYTTNHQ